MTQLPQEPSSNPVDTDLRRENVASANPNPVENSYSAYLVSGPHGSLRTQLLWVNRLLAYDESLSVSAISLRQLRGALSIFQSEVRLLAHVVPVPDAGATRSRSTIRTGPPSSGRNLRARTRAFKAGA